MTKRSSYTKEFKLAAVRPFESSGKPGVDIPRELGIRGNIRYKWYRVTVIMPFDDQAASQ